MGGGGFACQRAVFRGREQQQQGQAREGHRQHLAAGVQLSSRCGHSSAGVQCQGQQAAWPHQSARAAAAAGGEWVGRGVGSMNDW
jgi:hypothetical protein